MLRATENGDKPHLYGPFTSCANLTFYIWHLSFTCVVLFLKGAGFFFQESFDVMSTNDDNTLGFTLELYSRYMEAANVCQLFSFLFSGCYCWKIVFASKM